MGTVCALTLGRILMPPAGRCLAVGDPAGCPPALPACGARAAMFPGKCALTRGGRDFPIDL